MNLLQETLDKIGGADQAAAQAAEERQGQLTKPAGSLGYLETIGIELSGIYGICPPPIPEPAGVGIFVGDHGIQQQKVSPWPQDISFQMGANVASGGAAISVLTRHAGGKLRLYNVGCLADLPDSDDVFNVVIRRGTADMTKGPAMSVEEAIAAIEIGIKAANDAVKDGAKILVGGELGIGNTTPAAALIAVFTGLDAKQVTGRGAGADDAMLARKAELIDSAIKVNEVTAEAPLETLAAIGGLEHAALVGYTLGAAANKVPYVLDGVISCSAALVAQALKAEVVDYLIAGHNGAEPGIAPALAKLGKREVLSLGMRLGEGSGGVTALPVIVAAAKILNEMATFGDESGVSAEHE